MNDGFQIEFRARVNDKQYARLYTMEPLEVVCLTDPTQINRTAEAISKQVLEQIQTEITNQVVALIKENQERLFRYKNQY